MNSRDIPFFRNHVVNLGDEIMRAELEKKYGPISERARKIGAGQDYISARTGVKPLCVAHYLRGVTVVLKPHLQVKLMTLGREKSGGRMA
ncbi:hypothetical protein ES706_01580 [subsurface metagenome]|nr:hypothetical protein [Hadesarchaea archaeon]